jgi:hypothetical protein
VGKQPSGWTKTAILIHHRLAENTFGAVENIAFHTGSAATKFMCVTQLERWLSRRFFRSLFKRFTENTLPVK